MVYKLVSLTMGQRNRSTGKNMAISVRNCCLGVLLAVAGGASADTKIVQQSHQGSIAIMGQLQPATDTERVLWIGEQRLSMTEGDTSFIVQTDTNTLLVIDHVQQTVSRVALPVDFEELLPPGVLDQMMPMLAFEVHVKPTDETKMVGPWKARRYDVTMDSQFSTVENTVWATQDVEVDWNHYRRLFHQIISLQPGSQQMIEKLQAIDGLAVEESSVTRMKMAGDAEITSRDITVSVETLDPPPGVYDPPAGYTEQEFDLLAAMQRN